MTTSLLISGTWGPKLWREYQREKLWQPKVNSQPSSSLCWCGRHTRGVASYDCNPNTPLISMSTCSLYRSCVLLYIFVIILLHEAFLLVKINTIEYNFMVKFFE